MKIGILQLNPTVGDLDGNTARLAAGYQRLVAAGAGLVVAPELAIPGYPPRDLVFKGGFVDRNLDCLEHLAAQTGAVPMVVGYVDRHGNGIGNPLVNAAAFCVDGKVMARIGKTRLPTYDVFDEARYFEPSPAVAPVHWQGRRIGITICEDIWDDAWLPAPLYDRDPAAELRARGADLILNLSASPYHLGKPGTRLEMLRRVARDLGMPVVYVNAVGGNDQLVFDGNSVVVGADGRVMARSVGFAEAEAVVEIDDAGLADAGVPEADDDVCAELHAALVLGLRDYVTKCGFRTVLLGLSGGIDSALVAALAAEAVGPENVHGILMPGPFSSDHSVSDAVDLANRLGIHHAVVPITGMYESVIRGLADPFDGMAPDTTEENIQSRLRGLTLMALSNKFGHLLLTTGNKSEMAVGYCTIYGDMCGGLAVISDVPKTRVYELARWINRDRELIPVHTITKPPSAELRPDQTDQDSLPPYETLDAILEAYIERHQSTAGIIAGGFDADTVRRVVRLVDGNEWKRHQAAPGLRVTTKAFGVGRRMPIAQRYRG